MRSIRNLLLIAVLAASSFNALASDDIRVFRNEQQAQQHCPTDVVVWVNLPSGIYHFRGQRWYGVTKSGAFVCKKEADAYGYRPNRNGQ